MRSNAGFPKGKPGSIVFEEGSILEGLAYPDNVFKVVSYADTLNIFHRRHPAEGPQ